MSSTTWTLYSLIKYEAKMEFVRKLDFVDKFWPKMESLNRDFPYGVVHKLRHQEGGEGFQMMTFDYEGYRGGGLAEDFMI